MRVTVMGLGLNKGGLATTLFFLQQGADVTVTDLQDEQALLPCLEQLSGYPIRFVLGRHEKKDFINADVVIKGPAVPRTSLYLSYARHVETDLSLFLRAKTCRIFGITGTKGKSGTASLVQHVLQHAGIRSRLTGNIRNSPLNIWNELQEDDWLVMELSSFQLGDLAWLQQRPQHTTASWPDFILRPEISMVTNMSADHQNYYSSFADYRRDKLFLLREQTQDSWAVIHYDDPCAPFFTEGRAQKAIFGSESAACSSTCAAGAWCDDYTIHLRLPGRGTTDDMDIRCMELSTRIRTSKRHRENISGAALALSLLGVDIRAIFDGISEFPGLAHRLEHVREINGVHYYNDSSATIPEATEASLESFSEPVHLIAGGTDKEIDLSLFTTLAKQVKSLILLHGSASRKIQIMLQKENIAVEKVCKTMDSAVQYAAARACPGEIVLMSPGAASFELFANAYARGDSFKEAVMRLKQDLK